MQFFGQFGTVQPAQAGIEILWFVKVVADAPIGVMPQPALFPLRCFGQELAPSVPGVAASVATGALASPDAASFAIPTLASPDAASFAVPELASLDPVPLVAPLPVPPFEALPPLADVAPLAPPVPVAAVPEVRPVPPVPIPELASAPAVEAPVLEPAALVPLVTLCSGLVGLALHATATATKTAQPNAWPANTRPISWLWRLGRVSISSRAMPES
jgi:hypothetical protein